MERKKKKKDENKEKNKRRGKIPGRRSKGSEKGKMFKLFMFLDY